MATDAEALAHPGYGRRWLRFAPLSVDAVIADVWLQQTYCSEIHHRLLEARTG